MRDREWDALGQGMYSAVEARVLERGGSVRWSGREAGASRRG